MKLFKITFAFIILACNANNRQNKNSLKPSNFNLSASKNDTIVRITIEAIAQQIYSSRFDSLNLISFREKGFKIKDEAEESEGVEWASVNLYKNNALIIKIENSWEDKLRVERITFLGNYYKTSLGISCSNRFSDIKQIINNSKLNNSEDGSLIFFDAKHPEIAYVFDVSNSMNLYNGINSVSEIPDTLKINQIVVFRK